MYACVCVYTYMTVSVYGGQRRIPSPEASVTGDCELPNMGAGDWTGILQVQEGFLTTELFL